MKIPIVKVIDYRLKKKYREKLETSVNPMAMVVKAQLRSHEVKKADDDTKFEVTKELIRQCYKYGYSREKTKIIMNFFDWVIRLPEAFKERIKEEIKKVEEEYQMDYVPIWLRDEREEGIKIGERKGERKGKKDKAIETARRMLEDNLPIKTISKYTGLKEKEVKTLLN